MTPVILVLAGILPPLSDQTVLWHQHEMLYGFVGAGIAGFLLTAVPSFTGTASVTGRRLALLVALWLAARLSCGLLNWPQLMVPAVLNLAFFALVLAWSAPALLGDPHCRHRAFDCTLMALVLTQTAFFASLAGGLNIDPSAWLGLAIGLLATLLVVAGSRVSMQIVNDALGERGLQRRYLARPPRRNLAIACILLAAIGRFAWPDETISGWLALAAAAAMLNLLGDWHLGRVLAQAYVLVLYLVYWLLAVGYAVTGLQLLFGVWVGLSAAHLLTAGAMGLAMLAALTIAGQRHTGRFELSTHPVILLPFGLVIAGALLRTATLWLPGEWRMIIGYGLSSLLWSSAFALYLWRFGKWLTAPRIDGRPG